MQDSNDDKQGDSGLISTLLSQKNSPAAGTFTRLTVTDTVYLQPREYDGVAVESRFSKTLTTDEQAYGPRRINVAEQWAPLDVGWINEASMIVISNEEGKFLQKNPTSKEQENINARVVELAIAGAAGSESLIFSTIPPGQSVRLSPANLSRWLVRCHKGRAKILVTLFPM